MKDETGKIVKGKMDILELLEHMEAIHRGHYLKREKVWPCHNVFKTMREYIEDLERKAEPRHGKWEGIGQTAVTCSLCGAWSETATRYCGNCGARMDKDSRQEETKGEKMNMQENKTDAINRTNLEIYEGGIKVKDTMTGVEGTITAWCHYYGVETDQVRITYKSDNGVIIEDWVSVGRLAVVENDE